MDRQLKNLKPKLNLLPKEYRTGKLSTNFLLGIIFLLLIINILASVYFFVLQKDSIVENDTGALLLKLEDKIKERENLKKEKEQIVNDYNNLKSGPSWVSYLKKLDSFLPSNIDILEIVTNDDEKLILKGNAESIKSIEFFLEELAVHNFEAVLESVERIEDKLSFELVVSLPK